MKSKLLFILTDPALKLHITLTSAFFNTEPRGRFPYRYVFT